MDEQMATNEKSSTIEEAFKQEDIAKYKDELITILHKSQENFEKQLSYISAGTLALSIGFIKDVIKNIAKAEYKWLLNLGWVLLGATLLINCISHIRAADLHNRTISEINDGNYDHERIKKRYEEVSRVNWFTVTTLILGLIFIIIFVTINIYHE
ncbi:hypothetical protein SAMN05444410_104202 [Hydrobacter penzbergensis]|uniref:Uncharacterized protein n=1 Tax=Hydrobacter penzbergensis TaxID=1235997 RepID=A0A8X8IB96_9BACT|nr:hypothetical protein [Hydrobacter penzbergensis]SDW64667.1 hypothetical protein SAMN05444410_104202 [Hydrobacter penzbergensis]